MSSENFVEILCPPPPILESRNEVKLKIFSTVRQNFRFKAFLACHFTVWRKFLPRNQWEKYMERKQVATFKFGQESDFSQNVGNRQILEGH